MNNQILAPIAKKDKILLKNFRDERVDFYDWLRDKDYPNVNNKVILNYLESENNYANQELSKHSDLIDKIYNEIFVQTDVYSNPKEMDDLLAILCLSRMCTKLTLSFDTVAIGDNFRIMHADFLSKEGWMGHAKVVLK